MTDHQVTNEDLARQIATNTAELRHNTAETTRIANHIKEQNGRIGKLEQWRSYSTGRVDAAQAARAGRAWVYPLAISLAGGFVTAMCASSVGALIYIVFYR